MKLSFVHLHSPVFLFGRNWGDKIDVVSRTTGRMREDLTLELDWIEIRGEKKFFIILKCINERTKKPEEGYIHESNMITFIEMKEVPKQKSEKPQPVIDKSKIKAQASTPMGHVFEGPGAGKN